jgi:hypothetical protein
MSRRSTTDGFTTEEYAFFEAGERLAEPEPAVIDPGTSERPTLWDRLRSLLGGR